MHTLHESSPHIVWMGRSIKPVVTRPEVSDPVMVGDTDVDGGGCALYGSVIKEEGLFRMWYQARPAGEDISDDVTVAYAESDDGVNWRKPELGLVEFRENKNNNLVPLTYSCPSVFIDPTAPSSHRYRATGCMRRNYVFEGKKLDIPQDGYYTAHSADGLHWEPDGEGPRWPGIDVIVSCWDPYRNHGLVALKHVRRFGGIRRRMFHCGLLQDGDYGETYPSLMPDDYDDIRARENGAIATDYYGLGWIPQQDMTLALLLNHRINLPISTSDLDNYRPVGLFGKVDLTLIWRENHQSAWKHLPGRPTILEGRDPESWYGGCVYSSSNSISVGDEEWMYFHGTAAEHGDHLDKNWQIDRMRMDIMQRHTSDKVGIMRWKKGRFMGLQAPLYDEIRLFLPQPQPGDNMYVNARPMKGGRVRAEIISLKDRQPIAGYSVEDSHAVTTDETRVRLTWKGGAQLPPAGPDNPWMLKLCLERATVYGFDVAP